MLKNLFYLLILAIYLFAKPVFADSCFRIEVQNGDDIFGYYSNFSTRINQQLDWFNSQTTKKRKAIVCISQSTDDDREILLFSSVESIRKTGNFYVCNLRLPLIPDDEKV